MYEKKDIIRDYWARSHTPPSDYDEFINGSDNPEVARVAIAELDSILYRIAEEHPLGRSVEDTLYNSLQVIFEGRYNLPEVRYAISQMEELAKWSGCPLNYNAVVQLGYCVLGTGISETDALLSAGEWMHGDPTDEVTPLSEAAQGDVVVVPCSPEVYLRECDLSLNGNWDLDEEGILRIE